MKMLLYKLLNPRPFTFTPLKMRVSFFLTAKIYQQKSYINNREKDNFSFKLKVIETFTFHTYNDRIKMNSGVFTWYESANKKKEEAVAQSVARPLHQKLDQKKTIFL